MSRNTFLNFLFVIGYVVEHCVASDLTAKTVIDGMDLSFHCDTPGTPIWMMKSEEQARMHAIGIGSIKQSSFKDPRFDCHTDEKNNLCSL